MFLGQYYHNIDKKGRLTIPARYRELLDGSAYVTQGFEKNLMVLTETSFDAIQKHVNQMNMTDPTARNLKRLLFGGAEFVETDKSGRILLPQFLRNIVNLDGQAALVGVGDYFEIWAPDDWQQQMAVLQDTEANAQRFIGLELSSKD